MREVFEVDRYDAAGRLGELSVPRAGVTVETPALMPVVNPHVQTVTPARLEDHFGAEVLITNSYVLHGSEDLREPALERGLHQLLDFSGAIVTDSGSFQLSEYGEIDVTTEEILAFQRDIGSDIATPIDVPTPPDADRDVAERERATTQKRLEIAADSDPGEMLLTAPIQGSTYPDLREQAAEDAVATGLDVFPIGAVVPLMRNYRFADLVEVVAGAKRGLPENAPVHLFGAGHPMMFAMAVALGCDLFDSAAYALYARDDRYLTVRGTHHLEDITYFPCECPVCTTHDPDELEELPADRRQELLAEHNLHVSFGEIRRIKQAIRRGNLLELVETRARAHPAMADGLATFLDHADQLEATDPVRKDAFFYVSAESSRRPEVRRHHDRLDRLDPEGSVLLTTGARHGDYDETWRLVPPFGPVPPELSDAYPLTAQAPDRLHDVAYEAAVDGIERLRETADVDLTVAHEGWPDRVLDRLPSDVDLVDLSESRAGQLTTESTTSRGEAAPGEEATDG